MNREVMVKALKVIKESVINTDFPLTNKLADAIYAIDFELSKLEPVWWDDAEWVKAAQEDSAEFVERVSKRMRKKTEL